MVLSQLPHRKFDRAYIVNGGFDLGSADAAIRHRAAVSCEFGSAAAVSDGR
jgi:hypothetical protein